MLPQGMLNSIHQGDVHAKTVAAEKCQDQKSESLISMIRFAEPRYHAKKMVRKFLFPKYIRV
jgi:hypothetical protein